MPGTLSPTVRRRRLAFELRRLREAAKLTCEDVAELLECSASKISRVETARVTVSPRDVRDLLRIYGVPIDQQESLIQLARDSRQKGWWHAYGDSVQPHFATYLGMESAASQIKHVNLTRIPVLLQTEDYAREVIAAGRMRRSLQVTTGRSSCCWSVSGWPGPVRLTYGSCWTRLPCAVRSAAGRSCASRSST